VSPAAISALFALCVSTAPGANAQQSSASTTESLSGARLTEFTSLEPIDTHTHAFETGAAFVGMLERLHMHVLDILVVDDRNPYRTSTERQRQDALKFVVSSMGHAQLCTTFDPFQFNNANFPQEAIDALNQDFARGAVAVKIWKNVGMELKNASGQYVMPDDPRFEPIFRDIAAHHKTLIAHLAEPDAAWGFQDPHAPYAGYYKANPQWDMSKQPGAPQKEVILRARDHFLAMNPDLRVVGAHLGSMEDHLDQVDARLRLYPNFAVDTAARVQSLVIQPRDKAQAFIVKYQDRILYGTDLGFYPGRSDQAAAQDWENQYALDWRYFATDDSFEYHGHKVEGLNLPRSVLKKLYHENAVHWIPGIDASGH
jgi:predicted TIM-barrel fold metal-dependent hydrolase